MSTVIELEEKIKRLEEICAAAYQMAGAFSCPVRFLDVLSDPLQASQEQINNLLPITQNDVDEGRQCSPL